MSIERMQTKLRLLGEIEYEFDHQIELNEHDQAVRAVEDCLLDATPYLILDNASCIGFMGKTIKNQRIAKVEVSVDLEYPVDMYEQDIKEQACNSLAELIFVLAPCFKLLENNGVTFLSEPAPSDNVYAHPPKSQISTLEGSLIPAGLVLHPWQISDLNGHYGVNS